jgi:hypothetical protein
LQGSGSDLDEGLFGDEAEWSRHACLSASKDSELLRTEIPDGDRGPQRTEDTSGTSPARKDSELLRTEIPDGDRGPQRTEDTSGTSPAPAHRRCMRLLVRSGRRKSATGRMVHGM